VGKYFYIIFLLMILSSYPCWLQGHPEASKFIHVRKKVGTMPIVFL